MSERWDDALPVGGRGWAKRALEAEAKIQAVRQLCQSAIDESYLTDASIARAGLANRILQTLDGERGARD